MPYCINPFSDDAMWSIALAGLADADTRRITSVLSEHRYAPRAALYSEGVECSHINVLRSGRVRSFHYTAGGRETTNLVSGPGAVLGLIGISSDSPAVVSVEALEPVEAWRLDKADFLRLTVEVPGFAVNVSRILARLYADSVYRSRRNVDPAPVRLGKVLFGLLARIDDNSGEVRGLTQQDLSTMVDATRGWVTQMLNRLHRHKLVLLRRGLIQIPDIAALERHLGSLH